MANLRASAFLCSGNNDKKWRADLDWLLENPPKLRRLIEGVYGNGLHADGSVANGSEALPEHVQSFRPPERGVVLKVVSSC
jgi:hypothetical protein